MVQLRTDGPQAGLDLAALGAGPGRPHGEGWAICEQHRETIAGFIKDRIRLTKGRKLLLRQGIDVSYPTLHRFAISELGFGKRRLTIPAADCGPGEELQLDTGRMGSLEPGEDGKRHRFIYPVFTEQTADAIEACEVAWEYFGGIFRVIITDNTKAIVHISDPLDPVINITFQEYSQHRGFFIIQPLMPSLEVVMVEPDSDLLPSLRHRFVRLEINLLVLP